MMEMKMTLDWDKPIETMEGHSARVLSVDFQCRGELLVVTQIEYQGFSCVGYYHRNGEPNFHSVRIRNRKTKREGWINIYSNSSIFETEYQAKKEALSSTIATIKIEWEE